MKVYFNSRMSVEVAGFSPSPNKPAAAVSDWQERGLRVEVCDFEPVSEKDLCLAHDPDYVRGVLAGLISNGHGNFDPRVAESCRWTSGSMLAASRAAVSDGVAVSPSSGFHHAGYERNHGFCTFNGLIVSAEMLRAEGLVRKVGIIDCDAHYGDGTDDIIRRLKLQTRIKHWTFGQHFGLKPFSQAELLSELARSLKEMKSLGVGLVLYQAGADPHVEDPLGGFMTTDEMRERDRFVFQTCQSLRIPVAITLAGGYQRDSRGTIGPVLALHRATIVEATKVFFGQTEPKASGRKRRKSS
jgi:acetoin utilization deacetylase AcuC-like enzyme